MTNFPSCAIPSSGNEPGTNYTYLETMYHLMEIISRRLNPDLMAEATYAQIVDNCDVVENLRNKACAHIQDKDMCKTALQRLQYFAIQLHTSFVSSVACRPALRRDCPFEPHQKKALGSRCKANLAQTVRMFLAMHQLSVIPTRSWAFTYHGLSSALLLGILCETKADPEVRQLEGDLIAALSATAAKQSSPEPNIPTTDKDIELSGPLWRALTALKNIYDHGTIVGSHLIREGESSAEHSGNRTPLQPLVMSNQVPIAPANGQFRAVPPGGDPREDAAMAMAEMQNGASLSDFNTLVNSSQLSRTRSNMFRSPYSAPMQPNMPMDNLSQPNNMQYMAPMDLYDTIWGGQCLSVPQVNFR